ncbi:MAG: DUF262 domain-containing protein, partial [Syntrophorhabdales bacterium]
RRLKDMEMILRFFALYYHPQNYRSPMKDFLNRYMASNRELERQSESELVRVFEETTAAIAEAIGPPAFRPVRAINAAVIDSVMVGVARRLSAGPLHNPKELAERYQELLKNEKYRNAVETGTSQEANVQARLDLSTKAFAPIE